MRSLRTASFVWLIVGLACSCSSVRKEDDDGGLGGADTCLDALPEPPPSTTTVTVRNDTAQPLFFPPTCTSVGPQGIKLDGENVFLSPEIVLCSEAFEGACAPPPVNCGNPLVGELLPGASKTFTWHGGAYREVSPPATCMPQDCSGKPLTRCVAPGQLTAGAHVVELWFRYGDDAGLMGSRQVEVTLPAEVLTIAITP